MKLTLEIIIKYLGEPVRIRGGEYEWQCPYCMDSHEDNLKFNENKGILYCFANPEHSKELLRKICKSERHLNFYNDSSKKSLLNFDKNKLPAEKKSEDERFIDFVFYMEGCNVELLNDAEQLGFLLKSRGITAETVKDVKIGIDKDFSRWVIPTFKYETTILDDSYLPNVIGFEYRPLDLGKDGLSREKGCPTYLAQINKYTAKTKVLTIIEGYLDGYVLFQYLKEKNIVDLYHIITPSNGVNGLVKQIDIIDFRKYKKFELFLDSDAAGQRVADKILEKYPFFEKIELKCGCKDFNEHYLKCIKMIKY